MVTQYLPEADHVIRLVKPSLLMRDEITQEVIGCFPGAFKLREAERDLSVSWLEFFPGTKLERLQKVRDHAEMELRPNHGLAGLNVGQLQQACESNNAKVRVIHEPTKGNPSHSAIHRFPRENDELFALLANLARQDLTLCRNIPATSSDAAASGSGP